MNYTIKKYHNIKSIENYWRQIENSNVNLTPFQYYEYNAVLEKLFWFHKLKEIARWYQIRYVYYVIECDCKPIVIAPLVKIAKLEKGKLKKDYFILGARQSGVLDFVYKEIDQNDFNKAIGLLLDEIKLPLVLTSIKSNSKLYQFAVDNNHILKANSSYVTIQFGSDYDVYNKKLSKSTRQNIRTAYNRLNADNKKYEFKTICDEEDIKNLLDVYIDRVANKYHKRNNIITRFIYKHLQYYFVSFRKCQNSRYFVLMIDGQVAGFMAGFENLSRNYFVVPRLAINDAFNFYSPGILLINETIKYMINQLNIKELDLSLGEEKYKYSMGGGKIRWLSKCCITLISKLDSVVIIISSDETFNDIYINI